MVRLGDGGINRQLTMEKSMTKTRKIGRSAITGRFKPVKKAQQEKDTSVVETIKVKKKPK